MGIIFETRASDSPYIESIWRSHSEDTGPFTSMALNRIQLVVWNERGKTHFTVRGPETRATPAYYPVHSGYVGIVLKCGAFMPHLSVSRLCDNLLTLPATTDTRFWLHGAAWEYPDYENADTFVERLVRDGLLAYEPIVEATLRGQPEAISLRSAQRRFLRATGLTHTAVRQIERARYAMSLLQQGNSIMDTVVQASYFDQPHLTRLLRRYIGWTPAQLANTNRSEQLSFSYKTFPFW